jgi:small subunit ribosomal protein S1
MNSEVRKFALNNIEEEEDFEAMLNASMKRDNSSEGQFIKGTIVRISDEFVFVDVGTKSESRLILDEVKDAEGNLLFKENDEIQVLSFGSRGENLNISYKKGIRHQKKLDFITAHKEDYEELEVTGKITRKNKGGFVVEADDIEFFMPRSLAALKDMNTALGKEVTARVIKLEDNNSIVISRRAILNEKRKEKRIILKRLVDDKEMMTGIIKKIKSYGMFVDVEGVEGLVHYSEISYKGPVNPSTMFEEGDSVDVVATQYDKESKKLSLSIKAAQPDPWKDIEEQLEAGDTITVTVSNIEPYGVFVDLGNEIEGFLHISELSWEKNLAHPNEVVTVDQEIDVEVIELDLEERRLRVSLKRLMPKPFEDFLKNFKEGNVVTGTITSLTDFGAFVKIGTVEGLLHNEDASWDNNKAKELFKKGDEVEVKIARIDSRSERISLSRKALEKSPVETFANDNKVGGIISGKVQSIKDFGIFITLADGVDGLIRSEDLFPKKPEEISIGDELEAVISAVDHQRNRIRLSIKRLERQREQEDLKAFNQESEDESSTLGDVLKDALK